MFWKLRYWIGQNKVDSLSLWFDSLTKEQFKSVTKELKLLERCGNILRMPHSQALGQGLFELRERTFGLRIYYSFSTNHTIILLKGGNKSTQEKDIKIARLHLAVLKRDASNED